MTAEGFPADFNGNEKWAVFLGNLVFDANELRLFRNSFRVEGFKLA